MLYGARHYGFRQEFAPVWAAGLPQTLEAIKRSVQGERNDELFYDELIRMAPSREQAAIIESIRNDERKHNRMFRDMYRALTGSEITGASDEPHVGVRSYSEGLQRALFGELSAVEKYRSIWFGLPPGVYKDTVLGIIMDEQKHAAQYNYLFARNQTGPCK
ncbi:ferritin-like domain-containing protein [Paenibacillus flagellatus]|uniref:ferritin-like domain-containing protein n=1 Tax=Paenibacillus flagellatus TaxID=2211139 RepID=UPI001FEADB2E|nr:ferritin-like domain-containing protein [Paenibacillus flagellatus]